MTETLRGLVGHFQLADVFGLLRSGRQTGCLRLRHEKLESTLFVAEGLAVFGSSTKPELRFGRLLVRQGRLNSAEVEGLLGPGGPLAAGLTAGRSDRVGQMLVAERLLKQEELGPLLEAQTTEVFVDALTWKVGTFWFIEGETAPEGVVKVQVDLQGVVMESVRRQDEYARLPEIFPDRAIVYRSKVNPESLRQSVVLTMEEWQALFLLDGRRTLEGLCAVVADRDPLQTLDVVRRLLQGGFIEQCELDADPAFFESPRTLAFSSGAYGDIEAPPAPRPESAPPPPAAAASATTSFRSSAPAHDPEATMVRSAPSAAPEPTDPPSPAATGAEGPPDDEPETIVHAPAGLRYSSAGLPSTPWRLLIYEGRSQDASVSVITKDMTTIGRHMSNDIVFPANAVSGFHARIDRTPDGVEIVDLKSLNGTVVNGIPIAGPTPLADGDEITIRPFRIFVQFDVTASSASIPPLKR